jgi:hypothetical protein
MRKNILALSIATMIGGLGFGGTASADVITSAVTTIGATTPTIVTADSLRINADGVGHILVIPYFTVQNGNATLINLVNTDLTFGKAVKVRFRGAANSDDIFDFQVFLSPGDVFSGKVSRGADGRATFETSDKSCTLPKSVNQAFVTDRLPASYSTTQKAAQTNEGYVEIFNMGDIPKSRYVAQTNLNAGIADNPLYYATKHVSGVAPCNSPDSATAATAAAILARTAVDPTVHNAVVDLVTNAAYQGLGLPTTGLFANWIIVNVPGTNTWTGDATAIQAVITAPDYPAAVGNLVMHPQTNQAVGVASAATRTSDPLLAGGLVTLNNAGVGTSVAATGPNGAAAAVPAAMFDFPDLSTPYVTTSINPRFQAAAVTKSIAVTSVSNEFLTNNAITAKTDWVFSSPTRRYSVGMVYGSPFSRIYSDLGVGNRYFTDNNTSVDLGLGQICVLNVNPAARDREETSTVATTEFVISPGTQGAPLTFCGEVSVLSFNNTGTSVLGASIARKDIDVGYRDGWTTIATPGAVASGAGGAVGLPILGASFESAFNPTANTGVAGNYGLTFGHRYTR